MISPSVVATVSIRPGSVDAWLEIVAWVTVAAILTAIWVLRSYLRYASRGAEERRQITDLRPQLLSGTSVTVRIRRGFDDSEAIERLREGFSRDEAVEEDDATIRDVLSSLSDSASDVRPEWVPPLAWRGALEGALLLVVGIVAFVPLAYWRRATDPVPYDLADGLDALDAVISLAISGLAAFPYASEIYGLLVATGVLGLRGVWSAWFVVALALVVGAAALSWVDREVRRDGFVPTDVRLVSPSRAGLRLVVWSIAVWFVGVSVAAPFRVVGGDVVGIGELAAALLAVGVAGLGVARWITSSWRLISGIGEYHAAAKTAVVALLVLRRAYLAVAVVAVGLLVGVSGYILAEGRLLEVAGVLSEAPVWVLVSLSLGVVALVVITALQIPSVVEDLRDIGSRVTRSSALRLWVFARGIPIVGTVSTFAIVLALFASLLPAVGAAVGAGVLLRLGGALYTRAKYAALRRASGLERPVGEVHVSPFRVVDADGRGIWVADVDGDRLMHRERERLLEDVVDVVRERTESGGWIPTESEHYARRVEDGYVSLGELRKKLRTETRLETRLLLRDAGGSLEDVAVRDRLEDEYPDDVVDSEISELRRRGALDRRNDRLVLLD